MIFKYTDKNTRRTVTLDTDVIDYIVYHGDNSRAVIYRRHGFDSFSITLGELMLPFVNNGLASYVYCVGSDERHYLLNIDKVTSYSLVNEETVVGFQSVFKLVIPSIYAYQRIQKIVEKYGYEVKDSTEVYSGSESYS